MLSDEQMSKRWPFPYQMTSKWATGWGLSTCQLFFSGKKDAASSLARNHPRFFLQFATWKRSVENFQTEQWQQNPCIFDMNQSKNSRFVERNPNISISWPRKYISEILNVVVKISGKTSQPTNHKVNWTAWWILYGSNGLNTCEGMDFSATSKSPTFNAGKWLGDDPFFLGPTAYFHGHFVLVFSEGRSFGTNPLSSKGWQVSTWWVEIFSPTGQNFAAELGYLNTVEMKPVWSF